MFHSQVPLIVAELLNNESVYIQTLTKGLDDYITVFDEKKLPATLYGQKYHIFGNIDRIRTFHENVFYPSLQACGANVEQICHNFCGFIQVRTDNLLRTHTIY